MRSKLIQCFVLFQLLLGGCEPQSASKPNKSQNLKSNASVANENESPATPEEAIRHMQDGRPDLAMEVASKVLMTNPDDASCILIVAAIQRQRGQTVAARKTIDLVSNSESEVCRNAIKTKASWMIEDGDWTLAEENLRNVLEKQPACPIALRSLVEVLNRQGRRYEALPYLQRMCEMGYGRGDIILSGLDPRVPVYRPTDNEKIKTLKRGDQSIILAVAFDLLHQQEFEEVINHLRNRVFSRHAQSAAHSYMAYSAAHLGNWVDVKLSLEQIPADRWNNVFAWIAAGLMYEHEGAPEKALDCYVQSLQVYNSDTESLAAVTRLLGQQKDADEATQAKQYLNSAAELRLLMNKIGLTLKGDRYKDVDSISRLVELLRGIGRNTEAHYWDQQYLSKSETVAIEHNDFGYGNLPQQILKYSSNRVPDIVGQKITDTNSAASTSLGSESRPADISFVDVSATLGLKAFYNNGNPSDQSKDFRLHQINSGGVAVLDYDLDGNQDLFFQLGDSLSKSGARSDSAALMRNMQTKSFKNVYKDTGIVSQDWGMSVSAGDFDGDGFAELLITTIGRYYLCHNLGDGTYQNVSLPELPELKWGVSAACAIAEISGDELPELIVVNYVDVNEVMEKPIAQSKIPTNFKPSADVIYFNKGAFDFEPKLINESNFAANDGRGLGIVVDNFDNSLGNDVYIVNDVNANELLTSSALTGEDAQDEFKRYKLVDTAAACGAAYDTTGTPQASMGIAVGDFNNDQNLDLFVTNFLNEPNALYTGVKGGFVDQSRKYGFTINGKNTLGFGTQSVDLDGNGYLDLVVLNGHIGRFDGLPFRMEPEIFLGDSSGFHKLQARSVGEYFSKATLGRGLAYCDFDNDLRMDLVATHLDRNAALLKNQCKPGNRVQFRLVGVDCDRDATGARVYLKTGDQVLMRSLTRGSGYAASNEALIDVGLAQYDKIDELKIQWPGGKEQTFNDVPANNRYLAIQNQIALISDR